MSFYLNDYILLSLLLLSLYFDLTKKKIPNFLTFPIMLWGLFIHSFTGGFAGFQFSLYGLLLGLGLFFIPFVLGGMGGGDVKLLGAIGALQGAQFVFRAALFTALCGGFLAVIYLIYHGRLLGLLKKVLAIVAVPIFTALYVRFGSPLFNRVVLFFNSSIIEQDSDKKVYMPYGVAIFFGTLIALSSFLNLPVIL